MAILDAETTDVDFYVTFAGKLFLYSLDVEIATQELTQHWSSTTYLKKFLSTYGVFTNKNVTTVHILENKVIPCVCLGSVTVSPKTMDKDAVLSFNLYLGKKEFFNDRFYILTMDAGDELPTYWNVLSPGGYEHFRTWLFSMLEQNIT